MTIAVEHRRIDARPRQQAPLAPWVLLAMRVAPTVATGVLAFGGKEPQAVT